MKPRSFGVAFLATAVLLARLAAIGSRMLVQVTFLELDPAEAYVYRERPARGVQMLLEGTRLDARVAGRRLAPKAEQRTVPGDEVALLDLEDEVPQRGLVDGERLHPPAVGIEEMKKVA